MEDYKEKTREQEQIQNLYNNCIYILQLGAVLGFKIFRFCLYIVVLLLEMFTKLVRGLFLQGYKPFVNFKINRKNNLNKKAKSEFEKQFAIEFLTKHTYRFEKSELYNKIYKEIAVKFKDFAKNNVVFSEVDYIDLMDRINILTIESEKKGLQEGYIYAARTKYKHNNEDDIYNSYIEDKIKRGEGSSEIDQEYRES